MNQLLTAQIIKNVWGLNGGFNIITIMIIIIKKTIEPYKYIYIVAWA